MRSSNLALSRSGLRAATGVLIAFEERGEGYVARFRFATHRGEPVEFTSFASARNEERAIGDYVGVVYDPETPAGARLE